MLIISILLMLIVFQIEFDYILAHPVRIYPIQRKNERNYAWSTYLTKKGIEKEAKITIVIGRIFIL